MTEESMYSSASEWELLSDNAIVFRALLRKQWLDDVTGRIRFDAYLLRPNELGLSVNIATFCSPEKCAGRFKNCYGVASIEVRRVRELGLDVVPDSPSHALIIGLPYVKDDRDKAERLADLLAAQSRIVWQP